MKKPLNILLTFSLLAALMTGCSNSTAPDTTAPATPTGFQFDPDSSSDGQLKLVWDRNTESDIDGYILYRSVGSESAYSVLKTVSGVTGYSDRGLDYTTDYFYKMTAIDKSGNESDATSSVHARPANINTPAQPAFLTISGSNDGALKSILLLWTANHEADFDHYDLYRSTDMIFLADSSTLLAPSGVTNYTDRDIEVNVRYYYRVVAVDKGGLRSNVSSQANDIALPQPVLVSPASAALVATGRPVFEWERVDEAVKYSISIKTSKYSGEIWNSDVDQNTSGNVSYSYPSTQPALAAGTYYWSVVTYSKDGGSANSECEPLGFVISAK